MTPTPNPGPAPTLRPRAPRQRPGFLAAALLMALLAPRPCGAAPGDALPPVAPDRGPDLAGQGSEERRAQDIAALGFENVRLGSSLRSLAYENRRYRHSAEARGRAAALLASSPQSRVTFFERRLGLVAAAVVDTGGGVPASLRYPSDADFPAEPSGPPLVPTRRSLDLELVPLFTYELGRVHDPVLMRVEAAPRLRWNPWPGARASASVIIPLRNDFTVDDIHPDINRVRPGPLTLEQFAWLPGTALLSGTAGLLGANRYGVSLGAARPLASGSFLIDAQADLTGHIAFLANGTEYSSLSRWTGFAGVTWRPPLLDLAVRLRGQRFLYSDQGAELEVRRAMGDLEVAFFYQRTGGFDVSGVRLQVPVPPMVRPTGRPLRVLPVERVELDYRDFSEPLGRSVSGVASREDFLRQLSLPGLAANADRYRAARQGPDPARGRSGSSWVSLTGMTGFINTPWCGVIGDREVELGYNGMPRGAAYDHRGTHRNDVYYATLGFLPRMEAALRWTVIPGLRAFSDIVPDSRVTESDRMLSGRLELIPARTRRPGLAVGIEDAVGTRRFHSSYAVTGIPIAYQRLEGRVSLGYAPRVLTAARHTLDGLFGAVAVIPWRPVAAAVEYDTEKWNVMLGLHLGFGLRARAALLDLQHASFGAGWSVGL